jgi:hypothetical protein
MVHTLDTRRQQAVAERLETLIKRLEDSSDPQAPLLIEHLETTAALVSGSMPDEAINNLELAWSGARAVEDRDLRKTAMNEFSDLIRDLSPPGDVGRHPHERPLSHGAATADLSSFFHGTDTTFGIFYPAKFVVAVFWSLDSARHARQALRQIGFRDHDVIAVPGCELLRHLEELKKQSGIGGSLMKEFSRLIDTEASFVDRYHEWAKSGAAFLIVYSPEKDDANRAVEVLREFNPIAAHWYAASFVRTLNV